MLVEETREFSVMMGKPLPMYYKMAGLIHVSRFNNTGQSRKFLV